MIITRLQVIWLKNKKKVLLVGSGNLGSRYLQGLKLSPFIQKIYIYDISSEAISKSLSLFNETISAYNPSVFILSDLNEIPKNIDLAILSTSAFGRHNIIDKIIKISDVNTWIIEKLLSTSIYGLKKIQKLLENNKFVWVNHWMRTPFYFNNLKDSLSESEPLHIDVTGGNWGLACNSTHFMDFAQWLTSDRISLTQNCLLGKWFESKRLSYYELNGKVKFLFERGSTLSLKSENNEKPLNIEISQNSIKFQIFFINNLIQIKSKNKIQKYKFPYQSIITAPLVDDIFCKRDPKIPRLDETIYNHKIILKLLRKHWSSNIHLKSKKFRIT